MKRLAQQFSLILVLVGVVVALSGFGSAETDDSERRVVEGVVAEVDEQSSEWTRLVVVTADETRLDVQVPTDMARQFRIRPGDRFRSQEEILVRPGERLRVLRFAIDR